MQITSKRKISLSKNMNLLNDIFIKLRDKVYKFEIKLVSKYSKGNV